MTSTYKAEEVFTCTPSQIVLVQYLVPGGLGSREAEEAIARLLWFSKEEGTWVGVSYEKLLDEIFKDVKKWKECKDKEIQLNEIEFKNKITFGLYQKLKKVEVSPPKWDELPFSLLFSKGVHPFEKGMVELLDKKWVEFKRIGKTTFVFPKKELIDHIQLAQK